MSLFILLENDFSKANSSLEWLNLGIFRGSSISETFGNLVSENRFLTKLVLAQDK